MRWNVATEGLAFFRKRNARSVGPKLLQAVFFPRIRVENVDHHVCKVSDHPEALWIAINAKNFYVMVIPNAAYDVLPDGTQVGQGSACAYYGVVRDGTNLPHIQNGDVSGFLLRSVLRTDLGEP